MHVIQSIIMHEATYIDCGIFQCQKWSGHGPHQTEISNAPVGNIFIGHKY